MESGVQLSPVLRLQPTVPDRLETPPRARLLREDSIAPRSFLVTPRKRKPWRAVALGLLLMLTQLFVAVVVIAPEGPLSYRYETLVQHDSYWFANIIDRGYDTILPPMTRKMMEVSNVAFFPAYPMLSGILHRTTGISINQALLLVAQLAAWGFWAYFFLFCDRWNVSPVLQCFGALAIAAHPTAFYLVAAYSESLFLMALMGFLYWSSEEGKMAKVLAGVHGIVMSATRIVGIPCAAFPVFRAIFEKGFPRIGSIWTWMKQNAGAVALTIVSTFGALGFFLYCLVRWGRWDLYMETQEAGWAISPDYLALFKPENYHWSLPPLDDPTQWSQLTMTAGALCFVAIGICEWLPAIRQRTAWQTRIGIYLTAFITYYIAVSGVASVQMESMMRYQFCAHALIVLALMHFLAQFPTLPARVRAFGMAAVALLCAAGLSLQGWWVWNFTRGDWVA
jgi:hypothetical protein